MQHYPFLGDMLAANDFGQALGHGDPVQAGMAGAGLALGMVPVVGDAAAKGVKKARGKFTLDYFGSPVTVGKRQK